MKERRSGKDVKVFTDFYHEICRNRCLMNIISQPIYKDFDGRKVISGYRNHKVECGECWRYMDERLLKIAITKNKKT